MKKIYKICSIFILIVAILLVTGCEDKKTEKPKDDTPKTGNLENLKIIKSKRIEDSTLVFLLKNKDDYVIKNITVTVEFWKKADENAENAENNNSEGESEDILTGTTTKFFSIIEPSQTVAEQVSNGKREWDYYKIFIEETPDSKTNKIASDYDNLLFDDNTILTLPDICTEDGQENCVEEDKMPELSDKINLIIKNNSENKINYYQLGIVFYKDNEIVGYSSTNGSNLQSKKMRNDTAMFPINQITRKAIDFDDYTIYKIIAYHNTFE